MLDIRQRTGVLFIVVMVAQVILISAQVQSKSGVPVLQAVTFGAFSRVQRGDVGVFRRRGRLGQLRRAARRAGRKRDLKQRVAELRCGCRSSTRWRSGRSGCRSCWICGRARPCRRSRRR